MSEEFPGWETDKFGTMTLTVECRQDGTQDWR